MNKKADNIVVLSVTWFKESNTDNLPGYKAFNSIRTKKWVVDFKNFVETLYPIKLSKCQIQTLKYLNTSIISFTVPTRKYLILLTFFGHLRMGFEHVSYLKLKKYPTHFPVENLMSYVVI